jgi:hypothetical protein
MGLNRGIILKRILWNEGVDWNQLAQDMVHLRGLVTMVHSYHGCEHGETFEFHNERLISLAEQP